ncbi:MAG: DEAD/DEAH box helicase [Deltaproteobacteria bacterium]|nr:DEAD/DEAH box helicase [Deltaproteobacteria bacterium]
MPADYTQIVASLRRACKPGVWSAGVNLVRAGAVTVESQTDEEIVLRVRAGGRAVPAQVALYPGLDDWDCDCPGRQRPCEHLAAAAIALGQAGHAAADGAEAAIKTSAEVWARIAYRFGQADAGLTLRRFVVRADGGETALAGTLSALLGRPADARSLQVEQCDLQADRLLETSARAVLPPSKLDALVQVLVGCRMVFLDGRQVVMSEEEVLPHAVVTDDGDGAAVTIRRDPRIVAVPSAGVVLLGDELARHGEIDLCGGFLQNLPIVRRYGASELGDLATRILPELCRRMAVEVRTGRLPRIVRGIPPRIALELRQVGSSLSVLPALVYGHPPCARVDGGRLVHLGGAVPVRDEAGERRLAEKLRGDLDLVCGRRSTFEGADTTRFVEKLRRWRGEVAGDGASLVRARVRLEPELRVGSKVDGAFGLPEVRCDLDFAVRTEDRGESLGMVSAAAVLSAWQEGLGLVPLEGGGFAPLPEAWLAKHGHELAALLAARGGDGRVAAHALPTLGRLCEDLDQPPPPGLERLAPLFEAFERLPAAALPSDLTAVLRPYQGVAANWLAFLRSAGLGGILADDMGLGKTVEALAVMPGKTLVVCPTSVLPNWRAELRRFRPASRVNVYHGPTRRLDEGADVTLTTYAILRLDSEDLRRERWAAAILDEAQAIKNPDSQVARAAYGLAADFRLAMTGTPVENRLDELWSLMHFANRGLLGGRREFDAEFGRPISDGLPGVAEALRGRIRPFVLRRRKADVAPELPPRTEATLAITLDERERAVYDAVRAATQSELVAALGGAEKLDVMKALEALLRLRQAACHAGLLPGHKAATSSKVEALLEALRTAAEDGHKALVFSQWTSLLDLIEPALGQAGIPFCRLDGSTRDRGAVVDVFQDVTGPPVMLVSLRAGGTGLNLTAADHVFLCDPWWNPAVEDQAADRAHRIGQDKPVMIYRLVAAGTVEERILELQQRKRAVGDAALGDAAAAATLTREDLLALLG